MIVDSKRFDVKGFDSVKFFSRLTETNRLCQDFGFRPVVVSGLNGFEDALQHALDAQALICIDDSAQGFTDINNTPHNKIFRVVYMFMRHTIEENWMEARSYCFAVMREIFRQFMSVLIKEKTRLRLENVVINPSVSFNEIDRYFFMDGACAWFQIEVDKFISLEFNENEWTNNPIPPKLSRLDVNMSKPSTTQ